MKVTHSGDVSIYTVAGASTYQQLPSSFKKKRKRNWADEQPLQLLQDFGFEGHSVCVKVSEDGRWVVSTGAYKVCYLISFRSSRRSSSC